MAQIKYVTTLFSVTNSPRKEAGSDVGMKVESPTPPTNGEWRLINFQPVKVSDNNKTVFAAVWEEDK